MGRNDRIPHDLGYLGRKEKGAEKRTEPSFYMPTVHNDIYKDLTYPLLDFLIDRRLDTDSKGRYKPVDIEVEELGRFLDSTFYNVPERLEIKWQLLQKELEDIAQDIDPAGNKCLLKIETPDKLVMLANGDTDGGIIRLRYSREDLEEYKKYLKRGDMLAAQRDYLVLGAVPEVIEGRVMWGYGDDKIHIKGRAEKNYASRLCLLLYGKPAKIDGGRDMTIKEFAAVDQDELGYDDYEPGKSIDIGYLTKILIPDLSNSEIAGSRQKIRTAIEGLNKAFKKRWHKVPFNIKDNQVKIEKW